MSIFLNIAPNVNTYSFYEAIGNGINILGQTDFAHQIQPFQNGAGNPATMYFEKAVMSDTVTLLFKTQFNGVGVPYVPLLYVCDNFQNTIGAINLNVAPILKGYQAISGDTYTDPISGAIYPLLSSMWSFVWSTFSASLTPGNIYYLRLDNLDNAGNPFSYYSEPIQLNASLLNWQGYEFGQQNTLWFAAQYNANREQNTNVVITNWYNDYSFPAGGTVPFKPTFYTRVEGFLNTYDQKFVNLGYLQQNYEALFITGQQSPQRILKIGELSRGIPDYKLQTISEFLIADKCFINSTGNSNLATATAMWYKLAGANNSTVPGDLWKSKRDDQYPLLYASCPLMLGSNAQQAMVTPYSTPYGRIIDYTGDPTGA